MRPIPPLVASVPLTADKLHALRQSLHASVQASELELVRARILLAGFEQPDPADYGPLRELAALTPDSLEEL
jgi:hypothetical protein